MLEGFAARLQAVAGPDAVAHARLHTRRHLVVGEGRILTISSVRSRVRPMACLPYPRRTERESIANDAKHTFAMTPEERAEVFIDLDRTKEAIMESLPAAERRRRRDAARLLDPRPTPWWKNLRRSAWPGEAWTEDDATS